ncbi:MAG: twin-arginine translocase TatA/TatE family subunit [Candidatus Brocadiae bacterium]|nr:twin-arginine translocase TatA/TatE family subunit [Candidatus Brocadiia bacterium]
MHSLLPVAFLNLGAPEAILIGIVALILFGPRLPSVMRSLGKGIVEFKKGIRDTEDELNREIESTDRAADRRIDHKSDE